MEFDHKLLIRETDYGIITTHKALEYNPANVTSLKTSVKGHRRLFRKKLKELVTDRGFYYQDANNVPNVSNSRTPRLEKLIDYIFPFSAINKIRHDASIYQTENQYCARSKKCNNNIIPNIIRKRLLQLITIFHRHNHRKKRAINQMQTKPYFQK